MSWGSPRRPKISTKLGNPINREGSDGDIQVRGTGLGAKLFAKWSGRWWDVPLSRDGITKFGVTDSDYLSINKDSIDIYKDKLKVAEFGADNKIIGNMTLFGKIVVGNESGTVNDNASVVIGTNQDNEQGYYNVLIGPYAGGTVNSGAVGNTCVGYNAGDTIGNGTYNICIGGAAGDTINGGGKNICIGIGSDADAGASEQIAIGYLTTCAADETIRIGDANDYLLYDFSSGGSTTVTSDERIKKDIVKTDIGLEFINALRPVKYTRKEKHEYPGELFQNGVNEAKEGEKKLVGSVRMDGFVAQEVKQAMDDLNVTFSGWCQNNSSRQMLGYSLFVVPLTKAVQELSAKLDTMQEEINTLKAA